MKPSLLVLLLQIESKLSFSFSLHEDGEALND